MSDDQEYQSRQLKRRIKQRQLHRLKHEGMETKKFLEQSIGPKSIRVIKVHVNGLCKTQNQVVEKVASQVLQAKTFNDVFDLTKTVHGQLKSLGCFQKVDAVIDTSKMYPSDLEISFNVEELPFSSIHFDTETGDNEGLVCVSASVPNMSGRGERLESTIKLGNFGSQHVSLNYTLPIRNNLLWKMNSGLCGSSIMASMYRNTRKMSWSSLQGAFHGISLSAKLSPKPWLTQLVKWDCCWRQLSPLDSPGFPARSMCGHTLKSSLVNELSVDTLDDQPLPSSGMKLSFSQELAGIGLGNIAFFKTVATGAYFKQIAKNLIVGVTCGAGNMSHFIASSDDTTSVNTSSGLTCDKFHFGGPLLLRGFQKNRIGTREEGNDHLGSNAYWHLAIHGYTKKIPFLRGDSWLSKNVSAHIFSEICQTGDPSNSGSYSKWLIDSGLMTIRSSLGLGLIARLGERGRAELNYCIPIRSSSSDMINAGLQLGIGVTFT